MEDTLRELTQNVTFSAGKPPCLRQPDGIIFIRIPNSRKFLLMESVIQNSTQEIGNPANDWNPEFKFYCQGIRNPISTVKEIPRSRNP